MFTLLMELSDRGESLALPNSPTKISIITPSRREG
jgi:hypothetical protein